MDIRYLETFAIDIFWKELHQTLGGIVPHSRKFRTGNNMFLKQSSCNLPCFMFYVTSIHEFRSFTHFRKTFQSLNLSIFAWLFWWLGPNHCPPSKNIINRIGKKKHPSKNPIHRLRLFQKIFLTQFLPKRYSMEQKPIKMSSQKSQSCFPSKYNNLASFHQLFATSNCNDTVINCTQGRHIGGLKTPTTNLFPVATC